jgi:hypothetical protein
MREHLDLRENTRLQLEGKPVKAREERRPRGEQADAGEANTPLPEGQKWTGSLNYNGSPIAVDLVLTKLGESPEGVISVRNFHTGPIQDARLEGDTLKFRYAHSMGVSEIDLKINGDKASGTSTGASGTPLPLEFTLAGEPEPSDVPQFEDPVLAKVLAENPAGFVSSSKDERVWTTSANGWRERELPDFARDIEVNVRESDYDYITARLTQGVDIQLEFNLPHTLQAGPIPVYNVIAEIPGTEFPDEVIIISGHQDSWDGPGSQGTVDNGTGTSVTMEAARILMAAGAKPKRTIRFCLWGGEEQGLLGSARHTQMRRPEMERISAVFNHDTGTNWARGLSVTNGQEAAMRAVLGPVFELTPPDAGFEEPVFNLRAVRRLGSSGGSDHASFLAVGVPAFDWSLTGRSDYFSHTWHSQWDTYDEAIPEYMRHTSTVIALTVLGVANLPEKLVRDAIGGGNPLLDMIGSAYGMELDEKDTLKVTKLSQDGAAAKLGLLVGDRLAKLRGKELSRIEDFNGEVRAMRDEQATGPVELVVRRGEAETTLSVPAETLREVGQRRRRGARGGEAPAPQAGSETAPSQPQSGERRR